MQYGSLLLKKEAEVLLGVLVLGFLLCFCSMFSITCFSNVFPEKFSIIAWWENQFDLR